MTILLYLIGLLLLLNASIQDDQSDCLRQSSTEVIGKNVCNDISKGFTDKNYKCCWEKATKDGVTKYGCLRLQDTEATYNQIRQLVADQGIELDLFCDSVHDDPSMCNWLDSLSAFEPKRCTDVTQKFSDQTNKCCWGKWTKGSLSGNTCRRVKYERTSIQKLLDDFKGLGYTVQQYQCDVKDGNEDDNTVCNIPGSATEIKTETCYNNAKYFNDKKYKCCNIKATTKDAKTFYSCDRVYDIWRSMVTYKNNLEKDGDSVDMKCNSANDDAIYCSHFAEVDFDKSKCHQRSDGFSNKEYKCCYIKVTDDREKKTEYGCKRFTKTGEDIQKEIDAGKTNEFSVTVICGSGLIKTSIIIALGLIVVLF